MSRVALVAGLLVLALASTSCSKSPEQYFDSGNKYFKNKQFNDAIVQYKNAVKGNPLFGEAELKLAESYEAIDDLADAGREYIRAADLLPANIHAQVKAANSLLLAERFRDASTRAQKALAIDPRNVDALIVLGNASAGLKDMDGALKQIREAIDIDPSQGRIYTSLGALEAVRGNEQEAERAFKRATELDPKSVAAHLSLAYFYWASGRPADVEAAIAAAVRADPANIFANRFAATFFLTTNKPAEAEKYLKTVADKTKDARAALALADYYTLTNRPDDAIRTLESIAGQKEWFAAARSRVAAIEYANKKTVQAHKTVDDVLVREPRNPQALMVKARFLLAENKLDAALERARAACEADQRSAAAWYLVGTIYIAQNNREEAIKALNEVLKINPHATAARVQISQLQLAAGALQPAVQFAEDAVKNEPQSAAAHLALARGLLATGKVDRAEMELKTILAGAPNAPAVHTLMGTALKMKGDLGGSRKSYERALELDPNADDAIEGLVALDVASKKPADARVRVDRRLASSPNDGRLLLVSALLYEAAGEMSRAEETLQKAIEVAPANLALYDELARLYIRQQKLDSAKVKLEELAKRQPKPVGTQTMVATILQMQGDTGEAEKRYQLVLQIDPRAPVACNNLAWLYAERGQNLDVALRLAQTAKEQLPNQPDVDDTLGWVYYRKGLASLAVPPFQAALKAQPANPMYLYHLGLAYLGSGDKPRAKQSLEQALKLKPDFDGANQARQALATIK